MPNFIIHSPDTGNERWACRIGAVSREHAEQALADLEKEPGCPNNLVLTEVDSLYGEIKAHKKPLLKRVKRG